MSLPAMHTAVGMSVPFLAGLAGFLWKKRVTHRVLLVMVLTMMFCGIWAEVPDIPRFLPEEYRTLQARIMSWPYVDIFFFHGFLDTHYTEDRGLREGAAIVFAMFFLILFACGKSVRDNEQKIESLKAKSAMPKVLASGSPMPAKARYRDIVDIHCHVLPGVDDGPKDMDDAIRMCRRAVELGVASIVATPHLPWEGIYDTAKIRQAHSSLKEALAAQAMPLDVFLGADIRITWDLVDKLKKSEVFTLAGSRYFLLELDDFTVPEGLENFLSRCNREGFYPVLSHPERNVIFQSEMSRLKKIAEMPALIQISSCSLVGLQGKKALRAAIEFLEAGLVHLIASDAHSYNMRLEEFIKGLDAAVQVVGPEMVERMTRTTPSLMLGNIEIGKLKESLAV